MNLQSIHTPIDPILANDGGKGGVWRGLSPQEVEKGCGQEPVPIGLLDVCVAGNDKQTVEFSEAAFARLMRQEGYIERGKDMFWCGGSEKKGRQP